jgi:hypothetical protein
MHKLSLTLIALVILFYPLNAKAQNDFPDIDAFLKATLKNEDQLSVQAKGDLDGDGLEDWVGVIHGQKPDSRPTYQLYVLLRLAQGGYRIGEKSKEEEIPGMGCCWLEDLRISRASIFVQNNAKTATTMEAATHQFKLYKGEWRLIGVKIYYDDHTPGARSTKDTDMNLLTGTVIEKKQKGSRKPVIKRRQKKFATYLLKDFDFFNGFGTEMF